MLQLDVGINFDVFDIITIKGNGQIRLNTTQQNHVANGIMINANSFKLHIDGTVSLLDVIKLNTSVDVIVGGDQQVSYGTPGSYTYVNETVHEGQWFFGFSGQADFFGLATLNALGWVDSSGHFGVDLNGGITIGGGGFGLSGNFDVAAWLNESSCSSFGDTCEGDEYSFGVHFDASVDVDAFGFSLASVGIGATIMAHGTGTVDLVASVEVRIHFLFFTFSATANFDIGTVQLPKPIYLAGPASEHGSPISAGSADWTATAGSPQPIYLNMGTRAGANSYGFPGRGIGEDQQDESFTIDHIGGVAGNEIIQITAFGHSQTFSHVSEIHASGDVGNDTIVVDKGVLSPVFLDGGDGNDALLYDGSGGATLTGGAGGDVIIIGADAGGVISVDGGADSDYIVDNSSDPTVTIHGGSGDDSITGGYGGGSAHFLYGDDGNDIIASRGPNDAIDGGSGDDTITMNMPTGVMTSTIQGGSGTNTLAITMTNSADTIHVTHTNDIGISSTTGGSLTASSIHAVSLGLGSGHDTITVDDLSGSSVTSLTIDDGANDHAADAVTLDGSNNGDSFTISGNDPNTGIQVVHTVSTNVGWIQQIYVQHTVRSEGDTLTIVGGNGADTMDASLLGSPSSSSLPSAHPVDLVALTLMGGAGDDRLIGSPFNDVIDGGTSDAQGDTLTGGFGLDVFRSENTTAVDTLIETQDTDMGLYGNTFITGNALANDGHTAYEVSAGNYDSEDQLTAAMENSTANNGNPYFRQPGYGEQWSSATVEDITGIFSSAQLTGGAGNNTIVVNAIDGRIVANGSTRTVTTWNGDAVLDNGGNTSGVDAARVLRDHDRAGQHDGRRHRRLRRRLRHRRPRRVRLEPGRQPDARRRRPGRVRGRVHRVDRQLDDDAQLPGRRAARDLRARRQRQRPLERHRRDDRDRHGLRRRQPRRRHRAAHPGSGQPDARVPERRPGRRHRRT